MPRSYERQRQPRTIVVRVFLIIVLMLLLLSSIPPSSLSAEAAEVPVIDLELDGGYVTPLALENLKPGDMGSKSAVLRNVGNVDGEIAIWFSNVQETDYAGDGAHLDDYLRFEANCAGLSTDIRMPCGIWSLPDAPTGGEYIWVLNVRAGQTVQVNWYWEFVEDYQSQNEAQGDSLSFDINYMLGDIPPPSQGMSWLDVSVQGRATTALLDSEGRTMDDVVAFDEARSLSFNIYEGASCVSEDGRRISRIVILEEEGTFPVESGQALIGPLFSVTAFVTMEEQAHVFLDVPAVLRINYDPALLPSVTQTIGLYMHEDGSSWAPLAVPVDSPSYIGQCLGTVNRSGDVGIIATFDPAETAYFLPSGLDINPSKQVWWDPIIFASRVGKVIEITVVLTNIGQVAGEENVTLIVNGNLVETEPVVLGPLETKEVTFDLAGLDEGDYEIEVLGLSGHVVVGTEVNWWLIITFYCLALVAMVGIAYSASRWSEMGRRVDRLQRSINDMESKLTAPKATLDSMGGGSRFRNVQTSGASKTMDETAASLKSAQSVDETIAAYIASAEPQTSEKEERLWIGDSFNQVEKGLINEGASVTSPPQLMDGVILSLMDRPDEKTSGPKVEAPLKEQIEVGDQPSEESLVLEDSIQFEGDLEAQRMAFVKEFIMDRINSEGMLAVEEVPNRTSAMEAMAALGQLVEEGKLRILQEDRRTIYLKKEA